MCAAGDFRGCVCVHTHRGGESRRAETSGQDRLQLGWTEVSREVVAGVMRSGPRSRRHSAFYFYVQASFYFFCPSCKTEMPPR